MHVMTEKKLSVFKVQPSKHGAKNGFILVHGMSYVHVSGPLLHVEIDPTPQCSNRPYVKKSNSITCMESIMAYYGEKIEIAVEKRGTLMLLRCYIDDGQVQNSSITRRRTSKSSKVQKLLFSKEQSMGSILGHLENSHKYLKHLAMAACFMSLSIRISSQFETFAHTSTVVVKH